MGRISTAFIEPIHTDTALGMTHLEPCATDTDNVDLGQCDMVGPVDLRAERKWAKAGFSRARQQS